MTRLLLVACVVAAAACAAAVDGTCGGVRFTVSDAVVWRDNASVGRSGHMGHALVDCGNGRILDFSSNCAGMERASGHSGYGWMEYRTSEDYGRTFGPARVLPCSRKMYEEGRHTALCEKAVRAPDGRIVLFFQITDATRPISCEPWSEPLMAVSDDGGETFSDFLPTGADAGRIYDAVCDDRYVYFIMQSNPNFPGAGPEHAYKVYRAGPDLKFSPHVLPIDPAGRGYGALEFAEDGTLHAYAYNSRCEAEMDVTTSRDRGETWSAPRKSRVALKIRNPQVRRLRDVWFLIGRNGGFGKGDALAFYTSTDGVEWDEGVKLDVRPEGTGTGYYGCMLPIFEPGRPPRMLMQYSRPYRGSCVNVMHRTITLLDDRPRGALCMSFDDRSFDSWERCIPLFAKYGAHATFFVYGPIDARAEKCMKKLSAAGHSVGLHGQRHMSAAPSLKRLGEERYLRDEILPQLSECRRRGIPVRSFAYPNSARSDETDALLLRYFDRLRTGVARTGMTFPTKDAPTRKVVTGMPAGSPDDTPDKIVAMMPALAADGMTLVTYAHDIEKPGARHDRHNIGEKDLERILSAAKSAGVAVIGFDELPGSVKAQPLPDAQYEFTRQRLFPGFDGKLCKMQPTVATDGKGTAILTFQKLLLTGMDVFYGQFLSKSADGGATWGEPVEQTALADTQEGGFRVARYATVHYSARNAKWYAVGMAQLYKDDNAPFQKCVDGRPYGAPIYVSVDAAKGAFTGYKALPFPFEHEMALPFGQVLDMDNGDVLVPFYFRPPGAGKKSQCVTVRYRFDGDGLKIVEAGAPVVRDDLVRGVGEPSLARLGGKIYMTIRSDEAGMWSESADGLRFSAPRAWTWTDGIRIGNKNTQQHWVPCGDGLFLAYTREDHANGHVFRNRAPVYMARFDPLCGGLVRETEFAAVPELGARLGNFCVADSAAGAWLVTAEWMQPMGCERYGSDNSLWLVKFREKAAPAVSGARRVTSGPHEHLLANYFGINAWSPDFRKLVALETDLNGRLPEVGDACSIGLVDVATGVFEPFAKTACWNFQEAAMAHWLPSGEILYNDLRGGKFVTVVRNLASGGERVVPFPTSAVSPDGRTIVSLNYARLRLTRPDYGYPGDGQDARESVQWPEDDGLWIVDLATGKARLIVSVASCRDRMPQIGSKKGLAYFCHTTFSRDGSKIFWLARTVEDYDKASRKGDVGRKTVAFTCNADGTDVRRSFPDGWDGSHFNWKDGSTICVTAKFGARKWSHVEYTVGDELGAHILGGGALDWDGHCTYSPDGKWLSSEGYRDAMNNRHWKLLRLADGAVFDLGSFFVPEAYRPSHWRCDLHARWRADGRQLAFNSAHEGSRQIYVRDVAADGKAGN